MLRCKMRVQSVTRTLDSKGQVEAEHVCLVAVYGDTPENKDWSRWTPAAAFDITITNSKAFGQLTKDHEFYVDFSPANV